MHATFKPTNYTFKFNDQYFVERGFKEGSETVAAFADFDNAKRFAESLLDAPDYPSLRSNTTCVYVFTRTQMVLSLYKRYATAVRSFDEGLSLESGAARF